MPELIKFASIDGEGKTTGFEGWIDIQGWSWFVSHPTSGVPGGGYSSDKATFNDITITKSTDKATATLLKNMTFGTHFPTVEIVSLKTTGAAGAGIEKYLHVEMEKVFITSVGQSGGGSGAPMESVTMSYKIIKFKQQPQSETGVLEAESVFGIDLESYTEVA
jgi:type VI secretion system secreted protein Hcp